MLSTRGSSWCVLFGVVGLGLAGYLVYLHLGLLRGELLGGPACGSGAFNCHAVTAGAWGTVLGVPLAFWGIIGYVQRSFGLQDTVVITVPPPIDVIP